MSSLYAKSQDLNLSGVIAEALDLGSPEIPAPMSHAIHHGKHFSIMDIITAAYIGENRRQRDAKESRGAAQRRPKWQKRTQQCADGESRSI